MTTHTTNYENTFIAIADDCPAAIGEIPPLKDAGKTVANMQFDMVIEHPYKYTSDDVIFAVFALRNGVPKNELEEARTQFFSKGQRCFRASALTKRYGWGVHSDTDGKIALYACETKEYQRLLTDNKLKVVKAMKSAK
ncbi:MAG: DUF6157 family protein [Taibaiella sp.]|nr:DUF6157 family protein [Taibaiella sp.]